MAKPGGLVCYRNFCDHPDTIITLTSGDSGAILSPLSLLQARPLSERCVINEFTFAVTIDFGQIRKIDFMAVMGINFRVGGATIFNYSYKDNPPDDYSVSIQETVQDYMRQESEVPMIGCVPEPFTCRFLRIEVQWSSDDDVMQCGRLWASDAILFADGLQDNWAHGSVDTGTIDASVGSHYFENKNVKSDRMLIGSGDMNTLQAYGFTDEIGEMEEPETEDVPCVQGMQRVAGMTGEVIVVLRADKPLWVRRTAVYGHFAQVPTINKVGGPHYTTTFDVVQEC